jgi:hypothetical protein
MNVVAYLRELAHQASTSMVSSRESDLLRRVGPALIAVADVVELALEWKEFHVARNQHLVDHRPCPQDCTQFELISLKDDTLEDQFFHGDELARVTTLAEGRR